MRVTKIDAARRQLITAIRLFFDGGDRVSVYPLASNAWEINLSHQKSGPLHSWRDDLYLKKDHHAKPSRSTVRRQDRDEYPGEHSVEFLKLAIILGTVVGITKGIQIFSFHCRRRFGYRLFTKRGFWLAAIGINFLWWGFYACGTAYLRHDPQSGGIILMGMGLAAIAWLIYENIRDTDALHGAGGSALQLALFFPLAIYGVPMLLIALLFLLVLTFKAGPAAWFVDP
ncbi:hypothetical protein [Paraburkholderia sp. J41]|uniref:hypothetical protein n=1 Tax=Paraburkholderia sp. J41 TaxID=2805433 RepID=UPI002AC33C15|nr:hypothetical protein [Paraburkholderia sp. J41]